MTPNYNFRKQGGAALIFALIVLTVVTLLAVSSISDNQFQSSLVRNNQMRLDAFNASFSEINARIDALKARIDVTTFPIYVALFQNKALGTSYTTTDGEIEVLTPTAGINKTVEVFLQGDKCIVGGNNLDGSCKRLRFRSTAALTGTNVQSVQNQIVDIYIPNKQQ